MNEYNNAECLPKHCKQLWINEGDLALKMRQRTYDHDKDPFLIWGAYLIDRKVSYNDTASQGASYSALIFNEMCKIGIEMARGANFCWVKHFRQNWDQFYPFLFETVLHFVAVAENCHEYNSILFLIGIISANFTQDLRSRPWMRIDFWSRPPSRLGSKCLIPDVPKTKFRNTVLIFCSKLRVFCSTPVFKVT